MKYFTKDLLILSKKVQAVEDGGTYTEMTTVIPDKDYTEEEIRQLYDKALEKAIEEEKEMYGTPSMIEMAPLLDPDDFDPDDYIDFNEETGEVGRIGDTFEEVKARLEADYRQELEELKNLPPFDPASCIEFFAESYQNNLEYGVDFPEWVQEVVDRRLLALRYLPESVYQKLKAEEPTETEIDDFYSKREELENNLKKEWDLLPENIKDYFGFGFDLSRRYAHTCTITLLPENDDMIMKVGYWTMLEDGEEQEEFDYIRLKNAKILVNEIGECVDANYEMEEIYRMEDGSYEMHLLVTKAESGVSGYDGKTPYYITIGCSNIEVE